MKNTEPAKFMTTSESFRKLLLAHFEGDAEGFRVAAREYIQEERRKIRRLQLMMDMVMSVISQDMSLTVDEAAEMVAAAVAMVEVAIERPSNNRSKGHDA